MTQAYVFRQTKRDIEAYASDPTPDKRTFNLHLVSGKRLRMSLYRRSIDTSDTIFSEHTEKGTKEIVYKPRDCFFSGPLQDEEGYANLALCDGELVSKNIQYILNNMRYANERQAGGFG